MPKKSKNSSNPSIRVPHNPKTSKAEAKIQYVAKVLAYAYSQESKKMYELIQLNYPDYPVLLCPLRNVDFVR